MVEMKLILLKLNVSFRTNKIDNNANKIDKKTYIFDSWTTRAILQSYKKDFLVYFHFKQEVPV